MSGTKVTNRRCRIVEVKDCIKVQTILTICEATEARRDSVSCLAISMRSAFILTRLGADRNGKTFMISLPCDRIEHAC